MSRIVFLLEERSMKVLLDELLPRIRPGLDFLCVPHEGRQDLEQSIPRKLRAWREPGVRFIVVRDNDGGDCHALKDRIVRLCGQGGRPDTVVRIACQELEAWYFGDLRALSEAFAAPELRGLEGKKRFREPDSITQPAKALQELVPAFQKVSGARKMGQHLVPERNTSRSFQVLLDGVARLA